MEERIPQRPREAQAPTVAEPAPATGTPCDDNGDALAPAAQLLSPSSGEESSSSDDEEEGERDLDFEFPFVSRESPAGTAAPADELFADGRIRTFYPVFGRGAGCVVVARGSTSSGTAAPPPRVRGQLGQLFLEETRERSNSSTSSASSSTSSSSSSLGAATDDNDGLEGAAPESYCVWRPGPSASSSSASPRPQTPRKSGSTGSMARPRWRRISDLVVGRSHSDGRDKFLFLAAAPPPSRHDAPRRSKKPATAPAPAPGGARTKPPPSAAVVAAADADTAAAHRIAYLAASRGGLAGVPPGGTPRRTFLPYREELVGFFANVNGISRSHHHPL